MTMAPASDGWLTNYVRGNADGGVTVVSWWCDERGWWHARARVFAADGALRSSVFDGMSLRGNPYYRPEDVALELLAYATPRGVAQALI